MPTIHDLKSSKFLTKNDVERDVLVTITGYLQVNVAKEGVEPDFKWALSFAELDKPMVLNSTNGQLLAMICGSEDFDHWTGKKVVLYNDPSISFAGKLTGGIRVRAARNQAPVQPQSPQYQQPTYQQQSYQQPQAVPPVGYVAQPFIPTPGPASSDVPDSDLPF